jgi:hypothetical protein
MKNRLLISSLLAAAFLLVALSAQAGPPYAASAEAHDSVYVCGSWSSVQWYKSDGSYSGVGDPAVSDWKTHPQSNTPIDLSTYATDGNGWASSTIKVWAMPWPPTAGVLPTLAIHSWGNVYGVPENVGHWGSAYSEGGANWLTSAADQDVKVHLYYSYDLDLSLANPSNAYAFAKIYVGCWDGNGVSMLTPDAEWVAEGNFLVKTVRITSGELCNVTGNRDWDIHVTNGGFYSFWSMAWAEAFTGPCPVATDSASWGMIKTLFR